MIRMTQQCTMLWCAFQLKEVRHRGSTIKLIACACSILDWGQICRGTTNSKGLHPCLAGKFSCMLMHASSSHIVKGTES